MLFRLRPASSIWMGRKRAAAAAQPFFGGPLLQTIPLQPASLGRDQLARRLPEDAATKELLKRVRRSVSQVQLIVDGLLRFSRTGAPGTGPKPCGDDGLSSLSSYVIGLGRAEYERVKADPALAHESLNENELGEPISEVFQFLSPRAAPRRPGPACRAVPGARRGRRAAHGADSRPSGAPGAGTRGVRPASRSGKNNEGRPHPRGQPSCACGLRPSQFTFLMKLDRVSLLTIMLRLSARKLSAGVVFPAATVKAIFTPTSRSTV